MIDDDPGRLPTSVGGLLLSAVRLYARRLPLYAGLASAAFAVQFLLGALLPHTPGTIAGLSLVVDAFLVAAITIGVAADLAEKDVDTGYVLSAASLRWGPVAVVSLAYLLASWALHDGIYGSFETTAYGLFVLPIAILWAAIELAQVVASIEPVRSRLRLPLLALGKAASVSLRPANLSRMVVLSLLLALPGLFQTILSDELSQRKLPDAVFWGNVPIDALSVGPLQAIATLFFLDFLRRASRR